MARPNPVTTDGTASPPTAPTASGQAFTFEHRAVFAYKALALLFATLAIVPVLYWKHAFAATIYVAVLTLVHVVALVIFVWRIEWRRAFANPAGMFWRSVGLAFFTGMLALVRLDPASPLFWGGITALWALHTGALAMFHLRGTRTGRFGCPFLS